VSTQAGSNVLGKSSSSALSAQPTDARPAVSPPRAAPTHDGAVQDSTHRIDLGDIVSPLAAMVDEAMSHIESVPQAPLSGAPKASPSRRPLSYMPARIAEADLIATRLPALPLFSDLPGDRLREVARQMGIVRYKAGELLCESGAPEGPLYVIIEGAAWVGLAGDDAPAAIVTAGDFVGEITAMYGGPRTASVLAQGGLDAVALPPSLVRSLAREFQSFRDALREAACERMSESLPRLAPIFKRFEAFERKDAFAEFKIMPVSEGSQLLCEGEIADGMYIVAAGEVELYGGEFGIARAPRARVGEALGVGSTITGEPSGVSARAARDMLVAKLARDKYDDLASRFPTLAAALGDVGTPGRGVTC
jgi:CRP-like cAMP-binding protein